MPDRPDTRTKHKHKFSALWGHFGEYGSPNQHYHVCLDDDCGEMLVGEGRDCDGDRASHDVVLRNVPEDSS